MRTTKEKSATLQQVCVSLDHCLGVLDSCSGGLKKVLFDYNTYEV